LNRTSTYTGTSIPEGLFGAPATPTPPAAPAARDFFSRISAPPGDARIGTLAARAHTVEPAAPEATPEHQSPGRTFGFSYSPDEESDESMMDDGNETANQPEAQPTLDNAIDPALQPLDPSKQTPPPKPKPSHAQLPQALAQPTALEIAKAQAERHKPKKPSKLSDMTVMTPPHDKENRAPEAGETDAPEQRSVEVFKATWAHEVEEQRSLFDPEVLKAVDEAMEEDTAETQFRAEVADVRKIYPFQTDVMGLLDDVLPA
jgi:hypothetical protein